MRQIISIVIILVLVALLVSCRTDVKTLSWIDGGLFDGEYIYRYFPEGWYYYGKFNNPFGRTDGGDSFYSNDSGVFIKEKNRLFSSMAKAPLAKDTFSFPDIYGEESLVVFSGKSFGKIMLSSDLKNEFLNIYKKTSDPMRYRSGADMQYHGEIVSVLFCFSSVEELRYEPCLYLGKSDSSLFLYDSFGNFYTIDKESTLYSSIIVHWN